MGKMNGEKQRIAAINKELRGIALHYGIDYRKPEEQMLILKMMEAAVISGVLIMVLPSVTAAESIWFAMPITELIVAVFVVVMILRYNKLLDKS